MMRKLLSTTAAITVAASIAGGIVYAANVPLTTGPVDVGSLQAVVNSLIQSINANTTGNFAYQPGPVTNALGNPTTVNQTLASGIIPTGALVSVNQGYRARCAGTVGPNATAAKFGMTIGTQGTMVVSLETQTVGNPWDLEIELHAATAPVSANYTWMARAFGAPPSGSATNIMSVNSGVDTKVSDNNVNFALPITCVVYAGTGGVATGSVTMQNFSVEQLR